MNTEELINKLSEQTDLLRADINAATHEAREFTKRLELIVSQIHKNIEVRDNDFTEKFNAFCLALREKIDAQETIWSELRHQVRTAKAADFTADCSLSAKGFVSKGKTLSRSADEFTTLYDYFNKFYRSYTQSKINVWLLTSCSNDINGLTDKILFLARDVSRRIEKNRAK